ncbi:MAG: hypothetical protein E7330_00900 [Clostridiales bacterium]|nr:hypothetical protein [Clostridiales bacterium]
MPLIRTVLTVVLTLAILAGVCFAAAALAVFLIACRRRKGQEAFTVNRAIYEPFFPQMDAGKEWFLSRDPETVSITSADGLRLSAYVLPAKEAKGMLVLMHGYRAAGTRDFSCVLPFYHHEGYHIVLPDQRACGRSEGTYITFGVKEREDCCLWAEYAANRFGTDLPLYLDGISMGAATVLFALERPLPENTAGIIADSGYTSPMAIIEKVADEVLGRCPKALLRLSSHFAGFLAGFRFEDCHAPSILKENTTLPILFAHGEKDGFVPKEMTLLNHAAAAAEKQLILSPEAEHGLGFLMEPERYQAALLAFFVRAETLRAAVSEKNR